MRRILLAAVCVIGLALPALAQRAGTYTVEGQGADGSRYEGTVTFAPSGPNTWRVTWRIGGDTTQGVAILAPEGRMLAVGYIMAGDTGVAIYALQPDGRLQGTWTQGRGGGTGTEVLTPAGGAPRR